MIPEMPDAEQVVAVVPAGVTNSQERVVQRILPNEIREALKIGFLFTPVTITGKVRKR